MRYDVIFLILISDVGLAGPNTPKCEIAIDPQLSISCQSLRCSEFSGHQSAMKIELSQKPKNFAQILELIATTPEGRERIKTIWPQIKFGDIKISPITDTVRKQANFSKSLKALYDEETRTLYVDLNRESGLLAVDVFHEMGHAIDDAGIRCSKEASQRADELEESVNAILNKTRAKSLDDSSVSAFDKSRIKAMEREYSVFDQKCAFMKERKAFDEEYKQIESWTNIHSCYKKYSESKTSDLQYYGHKLSNDQIIRLYGLNPEFINPKDPSAPAPKAGVAR